MYDEPTERGVVFAPREVELPVEREGTPTDAEILDQKKRILKDIVGRPNEELEADEDTMALVRLRLLYFPPLRAYIPSL